MCWKYPSTARDTQGEEGGVLHRLFTLLITWQDAVHRSSFNISAAVIRCLLGDIQTCGSMRTIVPWKRYLVWDVRDPCCWDMITPAFFTICPCPPMPIHFKTNGQEPCFFLGLIFDMTDPSNQTLLDYSDGRKNDPVSGRPVTNAYCARTHQSSSSPTWRIQPLL